MTTESPEYNVKHNNCKSKWIQCTSHWPGIWESDIKLTRKDYFSYTLSIHHENYKAFKSIYKSGQYGTFYVPLRIQYWALYLIKHHSDRSCHKLSKPVSTDILTYSSLNHPIAHLSNSITTNICSSDIINKIRIPQVWPNEICYISYCHKVIHFLLMNYVWCQANFTNAIISLPWSA